jgi:hypothetical protein
VSLTWPQTMGWLRAAVGVALIAAPAAPMRLTGQDEPTAAEVLLMRTIGIRDLVLGLGTATAVFSGQALDIQRWLAATLASDSLDTVIAVASFRSIGKRDAAAAAALAMIFVCGDVQALKNATRSTR